MCNSRAVSGELHRTSLGGWRLVLSLVYRKGSRSCFQLKEVTACPMYLKCLFYIFQKERVQCPLLHMLVLRSRRAGSTRMRQFPGRLLQAEEISNAPHLPELSVTL